jgi:hypothetical protein
MASISQIVTYSLNAYDSAFHTLEERANAKNFDIDFEVEAD